MKDDLYPFPILGAAGEVLTATECTEKCLGYAQEAATEARLAIVNAREYVTKDFAHTFGALTVAFERRVAMHSWVHFARGYHTVAIAWEAMSTTRSYEVVMALQALESEGDVMSENAEAVAKRLGASAPAEACR